MLLDDLDVVLEPRPGQSEKGKGRYRQVYKHCVDDVSFLGVCSSFFWLSLHPLALMTHVTAVGFG